MPNLKHQVGFEPQGQVSNNRLRHGGLGVSWRHPATSDEGWGPIYGPQCFLLSKQRKSRLYLSVEVCQIQLVEYLGHLIAAVVGGSRLLGKAEVRRDCKMTIEARGFRHYVVEHGQ